MSILFPETQTTAQKGAGAYVSGYWQEDAETEVDISIDVQPMTSREIESLNIGRRDLGKIKAYSLVELKVGNEENETQGDMIVWRNKKYEVIQKEDRFNTFFQELNHYKYIAELRKDAPE